MGISVTVKVGSFSHLGKTYEQGNTHNMDVLFPEYSPEQRELTAKYWHTNGWVSCKDFGEDLPQPLGKVVTLDIDNVTMGMIDSN